TTETVTAGDEAAQKPSRPMPTSTKVLAANPPLASGGLGAATGDEFSSASARPADSPDPKRRERTQPLPATGEASQPEGQDSNTSPKASTEEG
ncbi:MAG TPA: hypothetical protein V6D23_19540, partial [Candidatus Obscuribacterales bacterium]